MTEQTADGRYIVVDGRRWRATDPDLPEDVRRALVAELMSARRAVKTALRDGESSALATARARVQDAKVALGERGTPWWEPQRASDIEARRLATARALDAGTHQDPSSGVHEPKAPR